MRSFALVALSLFATALAGPHALRGPSRVHHRGLAAHLAAPLAIRVPVLSEGTPVLIKRKSNSKRCKKRPTSSAAPAATPGVPVNVGGAPNTNPPPPPPKQDPPPPPKQNPPPPPKQNPPPPPPPSGSQSYLHGTQTGDGTFYGTGLGACGITNNDNDLIAAVSRKLFDTYPGYNGGNPNNNPVCGRRINAHYQGKSVSIIVTDRCEACETTSLDFSPRAFNMIADPSVGRIHGMTWEWA